MCKIAAQYVKACMRKVRKTGGQRPGRRVGRTDGDPDGQTSPYHNTARLKTGVLKRPSIAMRFLTTKQLRYAILSNENGKVT